MFNKKERKEKGEDGRKEKKKEKKEKEKKTSRRSESKAVISASEPSSTPPIERTVTRTESIVAPKERVSVKDLPQQNSNSSENKRPIPAENAIDEEDGRDEEGLVFSDEKGTYPVIKGGNIVKLVERLTYWKYNDSKYVKAFMLTFRSFTTPNEFFDLLMQRYNIEPPPNATEEEINNWNNQVLKVVRLRVYNIVKDWLTNGFSDFDEDPQLLAKLNSFLLQITPNLKAQLDKIIVKKRTEGDTTFVLSFGDQKPPPAHLPPPRQNLKDKTINILTFHPEELARQLTLIEFKLYGKIKPQECLHQNWMGKMKNELAPNILRKIARFNEVSTWIASEIVKPVDLAQRGKVLKHVIEMAEYCKALNNFNALMEIVSGLNSSSVFRLKQTWALLPKSLQKSLDDMNVLMARGSTNYKNFRLYLHNVNPPCIPYLGVYLTDLTFIEEGNKDNLPDGNINFMKRQRLSEVIAEIQTYQNTPYCLEEVPMIRDYLFNAESLPEEQLYKMSLKREAKEGTVLDADQDANDEPFGEMEKIPDYPFDTPDTDANITFERSNEENNIVLSGTPVKLIERLTHRSHQDIGFLNTFLMNLHKITNPTDFVGMLELRASMPKPKNPSKQQLQTFLSTRVLPVHLRILNVVKAWVNNYFEDFNESLLRRINALLDKLSDVNKGHSNTIEGIRKVMEKKQSEGVPIYRNKGIGHDHSGKEELSSLNTFSPLELAQQITALDQKIFLNVRSRECLCEEWQPITMANAAPNLLGLRNAADALKRWVCTEILIQENAEERLKTIVNLIFTAEKLLAMRNFNSAVALMAGFKQVKDDLERIGIWDWLPPSALDKYKELELTFKVPSRIKTLEKADDTKKTIPYIESAINQLTHINNMLPDFTAGGKLINFEKLRKLYEVFESWARYQADPFKFKATNAAAQYLAKAKVMSNDEIKKSASSLEKLSAQESRPDVSDILRLRLRSESVDQNDTSENTSTLDQDSSTLDESSPPTSPRTEREEEENDSPEQIRSQMLSIINEDKDFISEMVEFAKTDLSHDLLSELRKFTECVRDEIALSHSLMGVNSNGEAACGRVLYRLFPDEAIDQIVEYDAEGFVYGWEEEVSLFRVQSVDRCMLTHIAPHVGKSDLGCVFRLFQLFHNREDTDKEIKYVIISPSITEDARLIAETKGVILMDFY